MGPAGRPPSQEEGLRVGAPQPRPDPDEVERTRGACSLGYSYAKSESRCLIHPLETKLRANDFYNLTDENPLHTQGSPPGAELT